MQKKILLALDDSRVSENALKYGASMYQAASDLTYMLFHVQPTISQYLVDEARTKPKARAELEKLMRNSDIAGKALLETYRSKLIDLGIPGDRIQLLTLPRKTGVAKDILEYSTAMLYDAILIGRRGLSGVAELFVGSVSANVVDHSELIPVWLADGSSPSPNIMIAVDGSESALRAVDHMAFMLANREDVKITFLHVVPNLKDFCPVDFDDAGYDALEEIIRKGDRACIDRFYAHAGNKLKEFGISDRQVTFNTRQAAFRIGKTILEEYQKGGFGTLIIGRRGMDKKFFTGSVSRYLINHFSGGALWVVP